MRSEENKCQSGLCPFGQEYAHRPAWGRWQRLYVRLFGLVDLPGRLRARAIRKEIFLRQPQVILDVGFGVGAYSFYLSRFPYFKVYALEIDAQRVGEAIHIADILQRGNVKFLRGTLENIRREFSVESFDLVLVVEVLQYLPNLEEALVEIHRLLKPGGYLLGHIPHLGYLRPNEESIFNSPEFLQLLSKVHFQVLKMVPTFGGMIKKLCVIYQAVSRWPIVVGILFPLLLSIAAVFPVENPRGEYRLFLARKPLN